MNIIRQLTASPFTNIFYFICGPSWSGKTQLVYVLDVMAKFRMYCNNSGVNIDTSPSFLCVLHFVVSIGQNTLNPDLQTIYKVHGNFSKALVEAIEDDSNKINDALVLEAEKSELSKSFRNILRMANIEPTEIEAIKNDKSKLTELFKIRITPDMRISTGFMNALSNFFPWKALGVLHASIEYRISANNSVFNNEALHDESMLLTDFNGYVEKVSKVSSTPKPRYLPIIICLDEFSTTDGQSQGLIMLRNLLRISYVVPVLLGTNAKVSNLVGATSTNFDYSRGDNQTWCKLISKFPPFTQSSLEVMPDLPEKVKSWLSLSPYRPGIIKEYLSNLVTVTDIESLRQAAAETWGALWNKKVGLYEVNGILGYFQMFFSAYRAWPLKHMLPLNLIHSHLAHLHAGREMHYSNIPQILDVFKTPAASLYINVPFKKTFKMRAFQPKSILLDLNTDEVTQFIIFAGWEKPNQEPRLRTLWSCLQDVPAFMEAHRENQFEAEKKIVLNLVSPGKRLNIFSFPFRLFVEKLWESTFSAADFKSGAHERDGKKMECLVLGSMVKVSAVMGPKGSALKEFLPVFVSELQLYKSGSLVLTDHAIELIDDIKDQLVPFTLAAGYQLSTAFRMISGVIYTGSLPDAKNNQCIDGCLTPDWVDTLSSGKLTRIYPPKSKSNHQINSELVRIAKAQSNNPNCQLYISLEMKNYERRIGYERLKQILDKAIEKGRAFYGEVQDPEIQIPKHHLHIITLTSLAELQPESNTQLHQKFSKSMRLLKMTLNRRTREIDLIDLFPEETVEGSANEQGSDEDQIEPSRKSLRLSLKKKKTFDRNLSVVIIIPIETLFGFSLASGTSADE